MSSRSLPHRWLAACLTLATTHSASADAPEPILSAVPVYGNVIGEQTFTEAEIAVTPANNRDVSGLIITLPSARGSGAENTGANAGSLDVQDVSIHGASPYQNLFLIDGIGANNRMDPGHKSTAGGSVPSHGQAYFLDTALLGEVKVYDSFVPVEYGGFNGGVIDARLRQPGQQVRAEASYRWSGSNLTRIRAPQDPDGDWRLGTPGNTPSWRKQFYTASVELPVNDSLGAIFNVSRRGSRIERWRLGAINDVSKLERDDYDDQIDNFLGKLHWQASARSASELTLKYARRIEHLVSHLSRDTDWRHEHEGQGVGWSIEHELPRTLLSLRVGWDQAMSRRNSRHNTFVSHIFFDDDERSFSAGGWGKDDKRQQTLSLGLRADQAEFHTGDLRHTLYGGLDVERVQARFRRYTEAYTYAIYDFGIEDFPPMQANKVRYLPGSVNAAYTSAGLYASDRMVWRRLALTAGLRLDRDDFLRRNNLAPRTRLDWKVFGGDSTVLSTGWSRYYGGQILKMALEEKFSHLSELVLDHQGEPVSNGREIVRVRYDGLRTPYDDEWAAALSQRLGGMQASLAFVYRQGKDQLSKIGNSRRGFRYTNDGQSRTYDLDLRLSNQQAWGLGPTRWTWQASWSWQRSRRNHDLMTGYEGETRSHDTQVLYQGRKIRLADLPPSSFNLPQKAGLELIGQWPAMGLSWSNTAQWQGRRKEVHYLGTGPAPENLDRYTALHVAPFWTWDTRLMWQAPKGRGLQFSVDVLNVLNKTPALSTPAPERLHNVLHYRTGREIWLQAGLRY